MDIGSISAVVTSLASAKELGTAMLGIRDSNKVASTVTQLNDQILKAQEALLAHSLKMHELQENHFKALEELRAVKKLVADRGSYALHELTPGSFVYRSHFAERVGHDGNPVAPEPVHYVCQPCFDKDVKVVLQRADVWGKITLNCSHCKAEYLTT